MAFERERNSFKKKVVRVSNRSAGNDYGKRYKKEAVAGRT